MRVYIFKGPGDDYGFTGDLAGGNLPAEKGPWQLFREIDMARGESESRIGVRTDDVLDAIEKGSAYVTSVRIHRASQDLKKIDAGRSRSTVGTISWGLTMLSSVTLPKVWAR
jgi:hypothetical protein